MSVIAWLCKPSRRLFRQGLPVMRLLPVCPSTESNRDHFLQARFWPIRNGGCSIATTALIGTDLQP